MRWMQFTYDRLKRKALSIADLPAKDMESFCAIASPLKYNKGQILLKEGETCRNIYFCEARIFAVLSHLRWA
ncbi:MAG TPA: hypothetical protein VF939_20695 [Puia sp.]